MAPTTPGATLLFRIPKARFTRDFVRQALDLLFGVENVDASMQKSWKRQDTWAAARLDEVHTHRAVFQVESYWEPLKEGLNAIGMRTVAQYALEARNLLRLPEDGHVWLMVWLYEGNFGVTELDKAKRVTATFKRLVETLKPDFAAVDNYGENMVKRRGKDPRRFAWGAMYYDAEHVAKIGVHKLRGCAALIKQEYPDDGMWIQTWGNPFIVAKELTQEIEKELGLKQLF
jgi:hypothetical protein